MDDESPDLVQLKSAKLKVLQEILRQAELQIASQLAAAIAADARAYSFTGLTLASVVLLAGATYTLAPSNGPLSLVCGFLSIVLLMAAAIGSRAARSIDFGFAGSEPLQWVTDVVEKKSYERSLAEQCAHYQETIASNRLAMEQNGDLFNFAVNLALAGPMYIAVMFFPHVEYIYLFD